jgi:Zn-dependent metalloprotease
MGPLIAALLPVAFAALADERSETQIFRASTNLNVAPTLISPSVGEAVMPVSSEKLVSQNEKQGPIQSEARVALVSKLDADVPPELTQPIDVERFQEVQLTAAAKGAGSVVRSTAPRRGVHPAQKFGKNQLKLDPSAERQLLKINLALDDAKQSVQAAKSPVLRGGSSHKKTLAAPNKIALKSLNPSQVRVKHHKDGYVRRVSGQFKLESSSKSVTKQVDAFLLANYEELGLDPNFTYSLKESCNSSRCLIKAVKYFDGKEVFGDDLSLITVGDQIRTISGRMALWSSPAQAKMPASRANLEEIAKTHLGVVGEKLLADLDPVEGYRYVAGKYHSVMKLTVVTSMSDAWTVFVRTDSNQVIDKLPLSYDQSSVSSSGVDLLGETQAFFSQPLSNGAYRLIDDSFPATTGSQTTIGNMQNSEDFNAAVYVDAASSSGPWDAAAVSALVNSRKSYDYFKSRFGRNGIDGDDGEMLAFIHYKSNLVNAVYLDIGGGMMAYGDGDGVLSNSLARSLDVAGHELAHGVVARTAGLEYRFQSGALNESFADFFGTQIDGDDWLLGEDTWLQGPDCGGGQKCLRNMANPALSYSAQPTHMDEFQNLSIDVDKGGVHINSGIPNRALYLLAEGLSNAVGRSVAEQIAYQTLLALTPTSDFQDAAETMYEVTSVGDFSAAAAVAVADAWSGVGIEVEVQSPPPEVTPVETSSAQRSVIAYLYPDEGSTAYIPWLQSFDENTPAYDSARDGVALPSYADLSSPNPIGSFSRLSVAPENEDTEAGSYKGYWYAFVGDVDASGSHVYLNYFFNFTDSSTGNLVWAKASSPPAPIVYDNFTVQNIALSPNYANDGTFVLTIQDSPYIYVVTPDEVTSYAVSGPDYTSDGSGAAYVENIDSLRWDPSSRKVVFDYLSCVANPDGTCPSFWSVGVLDTVGAEVSYPFASQPPYIDLGYPAYSNTSDRYITMDLHRYDRDTGAYDSQSVIIFDTYEGGLYDSGAIPNGCGKDSAIWASPSFTSDDAWFIHQKCTGTPESYSNANYLTSRNEAGDLIETALNDYSSILPVATPGDEYHVDAYLEFRSRDSISEAGGANYSLTTPLAHGSPGVTLSGEFCWKNTTSVSSSILEAYTDDGIVSAFLPTTLKPGKAVCSTISIVPPKTLFENESGYIYVPKSIRSNAALSGSVRYSLEASLPEAPELSLYEAGADYLEITVDNISSGGDKTAVLYFDCGTFGTTLDFSESGALAQNKGVWSAHYDSGVTLRQEQLTPGITFTCEAKAGNRLGYGPTTTFTVSTLSIDSDGDGVPDDEDAFPNDASESADSDGDGVGDNADAFPNDANETADSDGDGVGDNADAFPNDANETTDSDGDGVGDNADAFPNDANETTDSDGDGVGDNADAFPNDANETTDSDGDGVGDNADAFPNDANETADSDGDGVGDNADAFPNDANETTDSDGDGVGDNADAFPNDPSRSADSDGDGVDDLADAFPDDPTETTDTDGDGVGDNADAFPNDANETTDSDGDGVGDNADAFPNDVDETTDSDGDGVGDNADAFPNDANETTDSDGDGVGDNADAFPNDPSRSADSDGDGVDDLADAFPDDPTETTDTDGDGVGDNADAFPNDANETTDSDGDGVGDNADAFPNDANETADSDGDGVGDNADAFPNDVDETTDSDGDGVGDNADAFPNDANETTDSDGDGVGDNADAFPNDPSRSADSDGDGVDDLADAFPDDPTETTDTDGDGVGDNADAFPNDANETTDSDGDGVGDNADAFPNDANETADSDGDGVGDNADAFPNDVDETTDSDSDGVGDNADAFPNDANETTDSDGDGVGDNADAFPNDANETADSDGDGVGDNADAFPNDANETADSDGDGVGDNTDAFPNDANETTDSDGDGVGDNADAFPNDVNETTDSDGDGVGDNADAFPNDANETADSDGDGVGDNADAFPNDASESADIDGDGIGDNADVFPNDPSESADTDGDGVGDNADAFPNDASETVDTDGDGVGDNSDPTPYGDGVDQDSDGVPDSVDAFPLDPNETTDTDGDGVGNNADDDDDGDGVSDSEDAFPLDANETVDTDGDGVGNNSDVDDDGDGVADAQDAFPLDGEESVDTDGDGVGDNADSTPNGEDSDRDGDGVPDLEDAFPNDSSETLDTDGDGIGNNADTDDDGDGYPDTRSIAGPLVDAGATSVCGTNADGYWCEVGDSNDAYLQTDAPNAYGTELAVGIDRACLLTDNGLNCWGSGAGLEPSLSEASSLSGYARHFCALDSDNAHCWGLNVSQTFISDVALVAAGDGFTCAVASGLNNAQCWSTSGTPLTGHFTDNSTALYAGKDLVCAKGSFQEDEFINCWKPSGMDSPRRLYGAGIAAVSVGSEACIADQDGVTCLVNEPGTTNFNPVTYPDLATSRLVAGDGFTCAEINGVLDCWGDGSDLETRLEGRTVAAPAVAYDAFPLDASEWLDSDGDGVGNNADNDDDGDGVADGEDAFPLDSGETLDTDGDGIGDNSDPTPNGDGGDTDGDGVPDTEDAFPNDASESLDTDGDGIGNNADTDDDGDGYPDTRSGH